MVSRDRVPYVRKFVAEEGADKRNGAKGKKHLDHCQEYASRGSIRLGEEQDALDRFERKRGEKGDEEQDRVTQGQEGRLRFRRATARRRGKELPVPLLDVPENPNQRQGGAEQCRGRNTDGRVGVEQVHQEARPARERLRPEPRDDRRARMRESSLFLVATIQTIVSGEPPFSKL